MCAIDRRQDIDARTNERLIDTTPEEPNAMPRAAVLETTMQDVHAKVQEAFYRDLAAYRDGVRSMAESGGELPEDRTTELLAVCQRLGISSSRLSADATTFIRLANINARIEAVNERNAARREPLPRLHQAMEEAEAEWLRVRVECTTKMQAAERKATDTRRAFDMVNNQRDERFERERDEILELENRSPHLFREMTADDLRRFLART
jgi:hypothetical protein